MRYSVRRPRVCRASIAMCEKEALRREMRERRRALSVEEQRCDSEAVCAHIIASPAYVQAHSVMAYAACRGEIDLSPLMEDALSRGKTLLLPRCEAAGEMTARQVSALSQLRPGAYGVQEPDETAAIWLPEAIELVLVPGVAFDLSGGRLGQGSGYYDRFLARTSALCVGVCHSFALLARVPVQAHDRRVHRIVTPDGMRVQEETT